MKKITLDPDRLHVESFEPGQPRQPRGGTVRGHSGDCGQTHWDMETCGWTCMNECVDSGTLPCTLCV